jgi:hypothetical protein
LGTDVAQALWVAGAATAAAEHHLVRRRVVGPARGLPGNETITIGGCAAVVGRA